MTCLKSIQKPVHLDLKNIDVKKMKIKLEELKLKDAKDILEAIEETTFDYNRMTNRVTLNEEKKWLKEITKKHKEGLVYEYKIMNNKKIVGIISLRVNPTKKYLGDIGYWIRESEQGKGIATEATKQILIKAKKIKMSGIEAIADPKNIASQKVLTKNGFTKIGILKKYIKVKGKLKDRVLYWKVL